MTDKKDDKKAKVISILKAVKPKKPRKKQPEPIRSQSINGDNNIQAGGDVYVNKRETIRPQYTPGPEHISPATARKIQKLVEKAVTIEESTGSNRKALFAKWWGIIKDRYNVATYREIPAHLGDAVVAWLTQQNAIMRPKLRRNDKPSWRKEYYTAIYARCGERGISKGELYAIVLDRLGLKITSLTTLSDQNLTRLYQIIMAL